MKTLFSSLLFFTVFLSYGQEYYVTVDGDSLNDGSSETQAWNIEHAFATATAGQTVWIKAGNYENKNLVVSNAGNEQEGYIRFVGYKNSPGDIISCFGSTFKYEDIVDPDEMPLVQGTFDQAVDKLTGLTITKDYIHIENIQISKYYGTNLYATGNFDVLKNIVSTDVGSFSNALYKGKGIVVGGNHAELLNSIVVNAAAEGITILGGDNQMHSHNKVYCDNVVNPTDYYYLITLSAKGNTVDPADSNTIDNAYVERIGPLAHFGHGIVHKVAATNNTVSNATIVNTNFEHNYKGVYGNVANNITIIGAQDPINNKNRSSFLFRNGAHDNEIKNSKLKDGFALAVFADKEDGFNGVGSELDTISAGKRNKLVNVIADGSLYGVDFDYYDLTTGAALDNGFYNCTFNNIKDLFRVDCANEGTYFKNCIFNNISNFKSNSPDRDFDLNIDDLAFQHCNFSDTSLENFPNHLKYTPQEYGYNNVLSDLNEGSGRSGIVAVSNTDISLGTISTSEHVVNGQYSLRIKVENVSSPTNMSATTTFDAEVGETYEITFYAKGTGRYSNTSQLTNQGFALSEGFVDPVGAKRVTLDWEKYTYTLEADEPNPKIRFYAGVNTSATDDDFLYVDKLSIRKVAIPELFETGNAASIGSEEKAVGDNFVQVSNAQIAPVSSGATCDGLYLIRGKQINKGTVSRFKYNFTAEIGQEYEITFCAKRSDNGLENGDALQRIKSWVGFNASPSIIPNTSWTTYRMCYRATQTNTELNFFPSAKNTVVASDVLLYLDNFSIKPIYRENVGARITSYDPNFVGNSFKLASGSSLIDKGITTLYTKDHLGYDRPGSGNGLSPQFDIGAFEYTIQSLPRQITLTSPCDGQLIKSGTTFSLSVSLFDPDDTIGSVNYSWTRNSSSGAFGTSTTAPNYKINSGLGTPEVYGIHVTAFDIQGNAIGLNTNAVNVTVIPSGSALKAEFPEEIQTVLVPNPTLNDITISGMLGSKKITLMDLSGRVISEMSSEQQAPSIDMQQYPAGIYLVSVKSTQVEKTFKVIKE